MTTPPVVPFPVASAKNIVRLGWSNAVGLIEASAGQVISVAQSSLEVIGEVIRSRQPATDVCVEHSCQPLTQRLCHVQMLIPLIGRLNGRQQSASSWTGETLVNRVNRGSLLVQLEGSLVVGPDTAEHPTGRTLGQGGRTRPEPDLVLIGDGWEEMQLLAIDIPEIHSMLIAV